MNFLKEIDIFKEIQLVWIADEISMLFGKLTNDKKIKLN